MEKKTGFEFIIEPQVCQGGNCEEDLGLDPTKSNAALFLVPSNDVPSYPACLYCLLHNKQAILCISCGEEMGHILWSEQDNIKAPAQGVCPNCFFAIKVHADELAMSLQRAVDKELGKAKRSRLEQLQEKLLRK